MVVVVVGKVVVVGTVDVGLVLVVEVVRTVVTTEDDVDEVDGVVVVVSTEAPLEQAVIRHTSGWVNHSPPGTIAWAPASCAAGSSRPAAS